MEIQKLSDQTLHLVTEEINHMSVQRQETDLHSSHYQLVSLNYMNCVAYITVQILFW